MGDRPRAPAFEFVFQILRNRLARAQRSTRFGGHLFERPLERAVAAPRNLLPDGNACAHGLGRDAGFFKGEAQIEERSTPNMPTSSATG